MSAKRKQRRPQVAQPAPQTKEWSVASFVKAFLVGFFVCSAIVRIAPLHPSVAFIIGGLAAGLAAAGVFEALLAAFLGQVATVLVMLIPVGQQTTELPQGLVALSFVGAVLGAAAGWAVARVVSRRWVAYALLGIIVIVFLASAVTVATPLAKSISVEMPAEQYSFDPVFFVKVFYLQEGGKAFYPAYGEAFAGDARFDKPTADLAGWRSPTTSTLWSLLFSHGGQIVWAFVLFAMLAMGAAYYLAAKVSDETSALVAPALLAPYYVAALRLFWFTEYEFWATFVLLGAAVLVSFKRYWPALGLAFFAGAMREWLISGAVASSVHLLLHRKWKKAIPWVLATFAIGAVYVANMYFVRRYLVSIDIAPALGATGRLGGGGVGFILYTLKFCADLLAHPLVVPYAVFALALAGAVQRVLAKDYYLAGLLVWPLCAFMIFGSSQTPMGPTGWNDYYNAAFWPFALVLAPAAWHFAGWKRSPVAAAETKQPPMKKKAKGRA